jgi:hypothetical protein
VTSEDAVTVGNTPETPLTATLVFEIEDVVSVLEDNAPYFTHGREPVYLAAEIELSVPVISPGT